MTDAPILARHRPAVEEALRGPLAGTDLPLYRMMAYQLGWVNDKGAPLGSEPPPRILGPLVLEVASVAGAPDGFALPHAASVEMLLNSCLIHADVADRNVERRGRASVPGVWGLAQATNAGDGMHAVARLALLGLSTRGVPPEAAAAYLEALDVAAVRFSEGEYHDMDSREGPPRDAGAYLRAVSRRDGALAGCAARLGALAGAVGARNAGDMAEFGSSVGAARRLSNDLALFWGNNGQRSGLAAKRSLPVEHVLENGTPDVRQAVRDMCEKGVLDAGDVATLARMLENAGSKAFTEAAVERLLADARAALSRTGLDEHAAARLGRLTCEIVRTPAE